MMIIIIVSIFSNHYIRESFIITCILFIVERAKEKVQDLEEELGIARKNYSQLGGINSEEQNQRKDIQEKNQY